MTELVHPITGELLDVTDRDALMDALNEGQTRMREYGKVKDATSAIRAHLFVSESAEKPYVVPPVKYRTSKQDALTKCPSCSANVKSVAA